MPTIEDLIDYLQQFSRQDLPIVLLTEDWTEPGDFLSLEAYFEDFANARSENNDGS